MSLSDNIGADIVPQPEIARQFLATLDDIHLVAILPDAKPKVNRDEETLGRHFGTDIDGAVQWAVRANEAGRGVYWTVNRVRPNLHKKAAESDILCGEFCHVDIDPPKTGAAFNKLAIADALNELAAPPSFIIDSGGGLQAFWRLDAPCQNIQSIKSINIQIRDYFDADNCQSMDHVMRLPGTVNFPDKRKLARGRVPVLAKILSPDDGTVYEPHVLSAAFPPIKASSADKLKGKTKGHAASLPIGECAAQTPDSINASQSVRELIEGPIPAQHNGDRSAWGLGVARILARENYSNAEITGILTNPANACAGHFVDQPDVMRAVQRVLDIVREDIPEPFKAGGDTRSAATPVDLWAKHDPVALPNGLLPPVIENFARAQGRLMGVDPAGLAMAALAVCAATISDTISIQVKEHDPTWRESARLWVALIGPPSSKKTPLMNAAARPLNAIDRSLFNQYSKAMAELASLTPAERKASPQPPQKRLCMSDTTIEAAQEILKDSPDGVLALHDELSGWFGQMDKYAAGKGAMADRSFWLQTFNGGAYRINRVSRGAALIPNLSVCVLGGIQPEPLRKIVHDAVDDGLIQRLLPVVLKSADVGIDAPLADEVITYDALIRRLFELRPPKPTGEGNLCGVLEAQPLHFNHDAHKVRAELEIKHHSMMQLETVSPKMASHFGKYDGIFARLCVIWHCIENGTAPNLPSIVTADTAKRVGRFLHEFIAPNAIAFYTGVLGLSDDHDDLSEIAAYILAHRLETVQSRDIQRGSGKMRALKAEESRALLEKLEFFSWLEPVTSPVKSRSPHWRVIPAVHVRFAERGKAEAERRKKAKEAILEALGQRDAA